MPLVSYHKNYMKRAHEQGVVSSAALIAVVMTVLFVSALVFGFWAFAGQQDYKNNAQKKIDAAVEAVQKENKEKLASDVAEALKSPTKTYTGSATFGAVTFNYPSTYSAYVNESKDATPPLSGYFHQGVIPAVDGSQPLALRVQIINNSYANELSSYSTPAKSGKVTISAFRAAKVSSVLGSRIDGAITTQFTGSLIMLPLRDKTLKIWTESNSFLADFNTYVVPSISFTP